MDNELLETLSKLLDEKLKPVIESQSRLEKKLDAVVAQTADLTEYRTVSIDKLTTIGSDVDEIKNSINTVEMVTSKNWNEITKLKAVK
jgi:hypothetical protein